MKIIYALVFVVMDKITLVDVLPTKSSCEYFMRQAPGTICVPVSVENPKEVIKQLQAIDTLLKE
jgi:hypothetical protein